PRPDLFKRRTNCGGVQDVDRLPGGARYCSRRSSARSVPGEDLEVLGGERIEEMAPGKTGCTGHANAVKHGRSDQRGRAFAPALNGEKLPMPARVNEIRKVLLL